MNQSAVAGPFDWIVIHEEAAAFRRSITESHAYSIHAVRWSHPWGGGGVADSRLGNPPIGSPGA